MTLRVQFLPGVPEVFKKVFQVRTLQHQPNSSVDTLCVFLVVQIQVAHLQPDEITLVGEGMFPCIGFDLPSQLTDPSYTEYESLRENALDNLKISCKRHTDNEVREIGIHIYMYMLALPCIYMYIFTHIHSVFIPAIL